VILVEIIFAAGEDYSGTNLTLSFPPEVDSLTAMLQIIDDNRLEAVEQFTANLLLGAGQDRVTLGADSATVEITDDDSKCLPSPRNFLLTSRCILCFQV